MARITWTAESERWLRDIHDFISMDKPGAASRVVRAIYERTQVLREYPEIGYLYRTEPEGAVRILLYGHYRIAYMIRTGGDIDILGVFHGALDIDRYLL